MAGLARVSACGGLGLPGAAGWITISPMDTAHILQIVQVSFQALGASAIAGGLIYTAVQFRRYQQSQYFANFSKLVELQMHLREMRVGDPSLAGVYRHDVEHLAAITDPAAADREIREYFFNLMQLSVFEIVWFGYKHRQLPEDYFKSWERRMREIAAEASFRRMWHTQSMKILHDEFLIYMQGLVAEVGAERAADVVAEVAAERGTKAERARREASREAS